MKSRPIIKTLLKILVIIIAYGYIAYRIRKDWHTIGSWESGELFPARLWLFISLVLALTLLNWSVEALKWQKLIVVMQKIPFFTALKAVLAGVTIGVFTPNRTGEYFGRIFVLEKHHRAKAVFSTITGSFSQLAVTIAMGLAAGALWMIFFPERTFFQALHPTAGGIVAVVLITGVLFLYFNIKYLVWIIKKIPFLRKYAGYYEIMGTYPRKTLLVILAASLCRYIIFLIQFFLLLIGFGAEVTLLQASLSVALIYFCMAAIPSFTLAELGIRGSVSLFFLGMFSANSMAIILASSALWIANLAIPAVIGSFFFYRTRI